MVNRLLAVALEAVFPQTCALCGLRSHRPQPLCRDCEQEMPRNWHCCARCALPLPDSPWAGPRHICSTCQHTPPPFARVIAPWLYADYFAHLIHLWKYRREQRMTALLADLWQQQVVLRTDIDVLVPVPLHWRRRWHRGFNQSELLARRLLASCPALSTSTLAPRLVMRTRATASQLGMNARQRAANLDGAFTARGACDNLRIAIVDDVLTTGATATTLANALLAAGAAHVEVWCLARTPAPGE